MSQNDPGKELATRSFVHGEMSAALGEPPHYHDRALSPQGAEKINNNVRVVLVAAAHGTTAELFDRAALGLTLAGKARTVVVTESWGFSPRVFEHFEPAKPGNAKEHRSDMAIMANNLYTQAKTNTLGFTINAFHYVRFLARSRGLETKAADFSNVDKRFWDAIIAYSLNDNLQQVDDLLNSGYLNLSLDEAVDTMWTITARMAHQPFINNEMRNQREWTAASVIKDVGLQLAEEKLAGVNAEDPEPDTILVYWGRNHIANLRQKLQSLGVACKVVDLVGGASEHKPGIQYDRDQLVNAYITKFFAVHCNVQMPVNVDLAAKIAAYEDFVAFAQRLTEVIGAMGLQSANMTSQLLKARATKLVQGLNSSTSN